MFTGRDYELKQLEKNFEQKQSRIITIYGRRRIGKSCLIERFAKGKNSLFFEALEREHTLEQIHHFTRSLAKQAKDPILAKAQLSTWEELFDYLTSFLQKQPAKTLLFFDEFQWMAAGHTRLVSLLKYYWDTQWKKTQVQLILCGSISSYMVKKVIKSKALYGRIDLEICLLDLSPAEALPLFKGKASKEEVLRYMLLFGGVPKYLELIDPKCSFDKNIQRLCFDSNSFFQTEFEKIFYSQFKSHRLHEKIVFLLNESPKTLDEIAKALKVKSGGGLVRYLNELELAHFISYYNPASARTSKVKKYILIDEFLNFYFKFIRTNKARAKMTNHHYFRQQVVPKWSSWLGLAFENFCFKNSHLIIDVLDVRNSTSKIGPYLRPGPNGVQIDLLIQTTEKCFYLCECKYYIEPVDSIVISEVQKKISKFVAPKGISLKKVLIAPSGATRAVVDSEYFDQIVTIDDLFHSFLRDKKS